VSEPRRKREKKEKQNGSSIVHLNFGWVLRRDGVSKGAEKTKGGQAGNKVTKSH